MKKTVILVLALLVGILAACGSQPGTENKNLQVAKVVIETQSVLLENIGATQQLSAKALDAGGNPVAASITWESSKPGNIAVDANGLAKGTAVGSSQIVATVGGIKSSPVIGAVGTLADGVARIAGDKIVSGPTFPEGSGPFIVGSQYTAVLKDVSPNAGKLWFSKAADGTPVQGKVISSKPVADGVEVTLEVVPITDIFKDLSADESVDLSSQDINVPEALSKKYDIQKMGNGVYHFEPKSGVQSSGVQALDFETAAFKCKGTLPQTTLSLGTPGFTLNTGNPRFEFNFHLPVPFLSAGDLRVLFTANPSLTITSGTQTINANFNNQSITCRFKNGITQGVSVFGFNLNATLTPGFIFGGSFGAGQRSFSMRLNARSNVRMGFDCRPPAGCTNLTRGNAGTVTGSLTSTGIGNLASTIRDLRVGAFADVRLSGDIPLLSLDLFDMREGYFMDFDLAPLSLQMNENNPADYRYQHFLQLDPFAPIKSFISFFLGSSAANSLGLDSINLNLNSVQSPLIQSATLATGTSSSTVTVHLDSSRINFFTIVSPFGLLYNIQKVQLVRKTIGGDVIVVRELSATSGQTTFTFNFSPRESTQGLFATIVPVILSPLPVGTVAVQ